MLFSVSARHFYSIMAAEWQSISIKLSGGQALTNIWARTPFLIKAKTDEMIGHLVKDKTKGGGIAQALVQLSGKASQDQAKANTTEFPICPSFIRNA